MRITITFALSLLFISLRGQEKDTSPYYESYTSDLTTRIYEVTKFNSLQFVDGDRSDLLTYRPNANVNVGFGFNYRGLGLNFGFRLPFFNKDDDKYVKTEHFNADANVYLRKLTMTAFFEIYKGYYLSENNDFRPEIRRGESILKRPDIGFLTIGASGVYVVSNKKVSYRAAFTQDEWQKKSAGSFLVGGYLTYTASEADSNMIVHSSTSDFRNLYLTSIKLLDLGPTFGYMYTLVVKEHFFATASLSGGFGLNALQAKLAEETVSRLNIDNRWQLRLATGYNSRRNYAGISYVNDINQVRVDAMRLRFNTGQFRINFIHRFAVGNMGIIDKIMDTFHWFFMPKKEMSTD